MGERQILKSYNRWTVNYNLRHAFFPHISFTLQPIDIAFEMKEQQLN